MLAIELARAESAGNAAGSLDELVRDRLARFGAVGAEVLRWAAVLSPRLDVGTLVKVSGIDAGTSAPPSTTPSGTACCASAIGA